MGLPASLLLTLVAITYFVSEDAPRSSKVTKLSYLLLGNMVWLSASMLETCFVLFLATQKATMHAPSTKKLIDLLKEEERGPSSVLMDLFSVSLFTKGLKALSTTTTPDDPRVTMAEIGMILDLLARVIYPVSYTIFFFAVFTSATE